MYECEACGEGPVESLGLCLDCARVHGDGATMERTAAWAMSALQRWQRHPGSDPFILYATLADGQGRASVDAVSGEASEAVVRAHDQVRLLDPFAFAFLGRGAVRTRDFGFDPTFADKLGAHRAAIVIAGVVGHPVALVVGQHLNRERPTFFQQIPTWLGRGPVLAPAPGAPLDVSIRLK